MKFHSLMSLALLLLAFDSGAVLLHPEAFPAPHNTAAAVSTGMEGTPGPDEGSVGDAAGAWVYQNGDLVLDIQDTAGAEILRAGLAFFFHDAYAAAADDAPSRTDVASHAQEQAGEPLPEPLSLSLLGVGFAVLGWTRRRGNQLGWLAQRLRRHLFPWPAMCWLD